MQKNIHKAITIATITLHQKDNLPLLVLIPFISDSAHQRVYNRDPAQHSQHLASTALKSASLVEKRRMGSRGLSASHQTINTTPEMSLPFGGNAEQLLAPSVKPGSRPLLQTFCSSERPDHNSLERVGRRRD